MGSQPRVSLRSLGGTVAMAAAHPGEAVSPRIGADELVSAVPGLAAIAEVDSASLSALPSASLTPSDLLGHLAHLDEACAAGSAGVVLTLGTDTMEEVAFLLDLLWRRPEPLVLTGAMRPADAAGADGPANLAAAVAVAACPAAAGRGVLVVMNDEVHGARAVRKTHTTSPAAFASPATGPVGRVHEGQPQFVGPPPHRCVIPSPPTSLPARVALLTLCLGDGTELLERAVEAYDGIVVEAFGGGHVPQWWAEPLAAAARRVPVVLASRTGNGPVLRHSYDFPGSEKGLLAAGLVSAGDFDGLKARILLTVALACTADRAEAAALVAQITAASEGRTGTMPDGPHRDRSQGEST